MIIMDETLLQDERKLILLGDMEKDKKSTMNIIYRT